MRFFVSNKFNIILIILGILLRLKHYLENRSFWLDEAWLAIDISVRTFRDIFSSKAFVCDLPVVPLGFALVEKSAIQLFGNNEYSFRLFPLLCGVASLFLFYEFLKRFFNPKGITVALGLFVFCDILIYYSSELKQYSTELSVILALYLLAGHVKFDERKKLFFLLLKFAGMLAICLSYSSVFVLAGIALTQVLFCVRHRNRHRIKRLFVVYAFWAACFFVFHWPSVKQMIDNGVISSGASKFFMPYPLWSSTALTWLAQSGLNIFSELVGLSFPILGVFIFVFGGIAIFRKNKTEFLMLISPIFFALFASALHKYPFAHRFLIFFIPAVLIFITQGVVLMLDSKRKFLIIFGWIVLGVLFLNPIKKAGYYLIHPRNTEDSRAVVQYLKRHYKKGDTLYLNHSAQFGYGYYLGYFNFGHRIEPVGRISDDVLTENNKRYILKQYVDYNFTDDGFLSGIKRRDNEVVRLHKNTRSLFGNNKRTWFFFSHPHARLKNFVIDLIESQGIKLREIERQGASIYLYDLSSSTQVREIKR